MKALEKMEQTFSKFKESSNPFFLVINGQAGIGKTILAEYFSIKKLKEIKGNVYKINANYSDIKNLNLPPLDFPPQAKRAFLSV